MNIFESKELIAQFISNIRSDGKSIGFVPTMGSLHNGHLSLIKKAADDNDVVVCSIFVNPIQFNNADDLKNYPRELENDIEKLVNAGCDVLFAPSEKEMYPEKVNDVYDMDGLDALMEGGCRPGHFNGVVTVVHKLLNIIGPCNAYFGEKDYQQLTIVKHMMKKLNVPVNIHACPTVREKDGLAMSSRNALLSEKERAAAPLIYQMLTFIKCNCRNLPLAELKEHVKNVIDANPLMKTDYIEIADKNNLQPATVYDNLNNLRVFIAVYVGNVRLIDNIDLG